MIMLLTRGVSRYLAAEHHPLRELSMTCQSVSLSARYLSPAISRFKWKTRKDEELLLH